MRREEFKYRTGFIAGAVVILIGLALQLIVGPLNWEVFSSPVNFIALVVLCLLIAQTYALRKRFAAASFLMKRQAAVPCLVYVTLLTALMGLLRQVPANEVSTDALGLSRMLSFWPFVLVYLWMTFIVGLVAFKSLLSLRTVSLRNFSVLLCHLGLFIALSTATLGNADMQRWKMVCLLDKPTDRVINERRQVKQMSVAIELKRFIFETSDEGMPRRFASDIVIHTKQGEQISATVDVNNPVKVKGWKIYQFGYDVEAGAATSYSILELIRDPWLPAVYSGIYMLLLGALLMFFTNNKNN